MVAVSNQGCVAIGSAALLGASFSAYQSLNALYQLTTDSSSSGIEREQTSVQRTFSNLLGGEASSQSSKILRGVAEATLWGVSAVVFGALASVTLDPKGEIVPNAMAKSYINIEPEFKEGSYDSLPAGRSIHQMLSDYFPSVFSPPEPLFFDTPLSWLKHNLWTHGIKENPAIALGVVSFAGYMKLNNDHSKLYVELLAKINLPPQPPTDDNMNRSPSTDSMKSIEGFANVGPLASPGDGSTTSGGSSFDLLSSPGSPSSLGSAGSPVHVAITDADVDVNHA